VAVGDLTLDRGRIIRELFADATGRPVDRDDPTAATVEVEDLHEDGATERVYGILG
jgi:hypothetical protein